jgi:hypothetical protein
MTAQLKVVVCIMLSVGFLSMLAVMGLIKYRLEDSLASGSYKAIFISKACFALLCASGIYLIIRPLPHRVVTVTFLWFFVLAVGCINSAVGYYLYTRDVNSVLESPDYIGQLPAGKSNGKHVDKEEGSGLA